MKKPTTFGRIVYGAVGITGLSSAIWALTNPDKFGDMSVWASIAFLIAVLGSVSWGVVAITNNRTKDLFGLLAL